MQKSMGLRMIPAFFSMIETQFKSKLNLKLPNFFKQKGNLHQFSCVATRQQNFVVERKHQHILQAARALKFHSNIPIQFWGECVLSALYLINRLPCPLLHNKSPYELLFHLSFIFTS